MYPFTAEQKLNIKRGEVLTKMMEEKITDAFRKNNVEYRAKRHHYIVGPSGIGKSITVRKLAERYRIPLIEVVGVASMNALAIRLANAVYNNHKNEDLFVWIDDCDSIFTEKDSLSVMKGCLDEDRNVFAWNKNMSAMMQKYEASEHERDRTTATALRQFQTPDGVGIEIPMDNVSFIVTANHSLAGSNPRPKGARLINEAAIRDRVAYLEISYDRNLSWGWMAAVVMKNAVYGLSRAQKRILLEFFDLHWEQISSPSMRMINELAVEMRNHPDNYLTYWEMRLAK